MPKNSSPENSKHIVKKRIIDILLFSWLLLISFHIFYCVVSLLNPNYALVGRFGVVFGGGIWLMISDIILIIAILLKKFNVKKFSLKNTLTFFLFLLGIPYTLFLCLVVFLFIAQGMNDIKYHIPARIASENQEYRSTLDTIKKMTRDTLLETNHEDPSVSPHMSLVSVQCLLANAFFVFGTNRSFDQVISDYTIGFGKLGGYEEHDNAHKYHELLEYTFLNKKVDVQIWPIAVEKAWHEEWKNFKTLYSVEVGFSDPSRLDCYGPPP